MRRLRAGKRHAAAGAPSGYSLSTTPRPGDLAPQRAVRAGVDAVEPAADHARSGGAPSAASAPAWAAPSMPRARPETTRDAGSAESAAPELVGHVEAVAGGPAGADDGDPGPGEVVEVARPEQDRRRVVVGRERRREGRTTRSGDADAGVEVGLPVRRPGRWRRQPGARRRPAVGDRHGPG